MTEVRGLRHWGAAPSSCTFVAVRRINRREKQDAIPGLTSKRTRLACDPHHILYVRDGLGSRRQYVNHITSCM